jgi:hypothetical protein
MKKVLYYVLICEIINIVRSNKYFWSVYCKLEINNLIFLKLYGSKKESSKEGSKKDYKEASIVSFSFSKKLPSKVGSFLFFMLIYIYEFI